MYDGHRWKITGNKAFPPKPRVDSDALSVLAFSDEDLVSDEEGSIAASKPPYPANKPSTQANEPPTRANEPPIGVFEPQTQSDKPCSEAGNQKPRQLCHQMGLIIMTQISGAPRGNRRRILLFFTTKNNKNNNNNK